MFLYSYTALVIYSCARSSFVSLLAVESPARSKWLCRPEVFLLLILMAVDKQLHRADDIQLRRICSCFSDCG